jgi:hypothetical protein
LLIRSKYWVSVRSMALPACTRLSSGSRTASLRSGRIPRY